MSNDNPKKVSDESLAAMDRLVKGVFAATKGIAAAGLNGTEATAALMVTLGLAAEANHISDDEFIKSLLEARKAAAELVAAMRAKGWLPPDVSSN